MKGDNMIKGQRVKVIATRTLSPWGREVYGTVYGTDTDGTIAIEVEGEQLGHECRLARDPVPAKNGWWFMADEVQELPGIS